jgi:hypothetical protein
MAARRLLILLLVLLAISTIGTLAIDPPRDDDQATETQSEPAPPPTELTKAPDAARQLEAAIDVGEKKVKVLPIAVGDQLRLRVRSARADQVEIPALGLVEPVSADAPAIFDLLLDRAGSYEVLLVDAGRVVGRLAVTREAPPEPTPKKGSGRP